MKDYEFLRWLANCDPTPYISLQAQQTRLHAIADQIERLSNASEGAGHLGHMTASPIVGLRRVCTLLCGHALYVDSPRMGADAYCSACVAMYRIVSIHRDY